MRVAYLTARSYRGAPLGPGEVPELERRSRELLLAAGETRGVSLPLEYWDDESLLTRDYGAALIRTCWDYHERPEAFAAALETYERAGLRVFNPSALVRWNMRKTYLRELGGSAIETIWTDRADARAIASAFDALDAAEIVVKPQVGAGAIDTVRLTRNAWSEADLIAAPRGPAMIQPFLRAIETEGERSLFWFGERFSHAVRKVPEHGGWLANRPGRTRFFAEAPPAAAIEAAEAARAHIPHEALYVRIDLVLSDDGRWRVIEIEAIEPYLFLDFAPEGADALVGALSRVLSP